MSIATYSPATDRRFDAAQYLAFLETRPSEERWQLIEGIAMQMTPPTLRHQRVARNLAYLLNDHFETTRRPLGAYQEVGVLVPAVEAFRPEADVAVLPDGINLDTPFASSFLLAAEVLSPSNRDADVEIKRTRYQLHPDNLYVLVISQTEVRVEVAARAQDWRSVTLASLDDTLTLPVLGFSCRVRAIYHGTGVGGA